MKPYQLPFKEAVDVIRSKKLSPKELLTSCLSRAAESQEKVNAYAYLDHEGAIEAAKRAEMEIQRGEWKGPLHGIPVAVKANTSVKDLPNTASSAVRKGAVSSADASLVSALRSEGAVVIGTAHTHEFAFGGITPQTRNPWDVNRIVGGSSGGSAAAVTLGTCTISTGTDTGGSIRIPAGLCGVVGFKPTFGLVPRHGITPLSWSLDHAGLLTRNTYEAAVALQIVARQDTRDPSSLAGVQPAGDELAMSDLSGLTIGVPENHFFESATEEAQQATFDSIKKLELLGATVRAVTIPHGDLLHGIDRAIVLSEAATYHEEELALSFRAYSDDLRTSLVAGQHVRAIDYIKAQRARHIVLHAWHNIFREVDVLVYPGMPYEAPMVGKDRITWENGKVEPITRPTARLNLPATITGFPAVSLPSGFSSNGLPLAIQFMTKPLGDYLLLQLAGIYEAHSDSIGLLAPYE